MAVIGTAEVAVSPVTTGFATKLQSQVAASNFTANLEKQFANAGILSGNAFADKAVGALKIAGFGNAGVGLGIALVAGVGVGLAGLGAKFDSAFDTIRTTTGQTGKALDGLNASFEAVFKDVPASADEVASAIAGINQKIGLTGPPLEKLASQFIKLSKLTDTDLGGNVKALTEVFTSFNVKGTQTAAVTDLLFRASQRSGVAVADLASQLTTSGVQLRAVGLDLKDATALIALLGKEGLAAADVIPSITHALSEAAKSGKSAAVVFKDTFTGIRDSASDIEAAGIALDVFGARAGPRLAALIREGKLSYEQFSKAIANGDSIDKAAAATFDWQEKLRVLINRLELGLAPAAAKVFDGITSVVEQAEIPVLLLADAFQKLEVAIAPAAAPLALFLVNTLSQALPILTDFATGLDGVARALGVLDPALVTAIGVVGGLTAAIAALNAVGGLESIFVFAGVLALENPVIAALLAITAAITALGVLMRSFKQPVDDTAKGIRNLRAAMFDTGNEAGIFAGSIRSAGEGFADFVKASQQSHTGLPVVKSLLRDAGTSADLLGRALDAGGTQWINYAHAVEEAAVAGGNFTKVRAAEAISIIKTQFDAAARQALRFAVGAKQISAVQVEAIKVQNTNTRGVVNYGQVLNDVNQVVVLHASRLALLAEQQTQAALTTAQTSKAYADLSRQIALGTISQQDAQDALEGMGVDASLVEDKFKDLQTQIQSFVDTAVGQLPTVATAISQFSQDLDADSSAIAGALQGRSQAFVDFLQSFGSKAAAAQAALTPINVKILADQEAIRNGTVSTTDQLDADLHRRNDILRATAAGSSKASREAAQAIIANNRTIHNSYLQLIQDNDPGKFTKLLVDQAVKVLTFTANLKALLKQGFGSLAGELAKLGPDAAGALAASLANNASKAKVADAAATIAEGANAAFAGLLKLKFPELQGGAEAGEEVGKGISKGITDELLRQFPQLRLLGIGAGTEIGKGLGAGFAAVDLRRFGLDAGLAAGAGVSEGLTSSLPRVASDLRRFGSDGGLAYSEGLAGGIAENGPLAVAAAAAVADAVLKIQQDHFEAQSPSRAAMRIGAFYGQGLALGISGSVDLVKAAATLLAAQTISATSGLTTGIATSISTGITEGFAVPLPTLSTTAAVTPVVGALPAFSAPVVLQPVLPTIDPVDVQANVRFAGLDAALEKLRDKTARNPIPAFLDPTDPGDVIDPDRTPGGLGNIGDILRKLLGQGAIDKGLGDILRDLLSQGHKAPPDAQTIADIATSLQVSGQSGATRRNALQQQQDVALSRTGAPLIGQVTIREESDIAKLKSELSWALRNPS